MAVKTFRTLSKVVHGLMTSKICSFNVVLTPFWTLVNVLLGMAL